MSNNYPGIGYKLQGRDFNFYQLISVNNTTFGGQSVDGYQPSTIITFPTQSVLLLNEGSSGTQVIEVSYNGTTVHDVLNPTNASAGLTFDNRVISLIWLRLQAGSSGPVNVSIRAWGTR